MKQLLLFFILLTLSVSISAQPWKTYLESNQKASELALDDYRTAFNQWVADNNIVNGKKLIDGNWVKVPGFKQFKRWEYYWESRVDNTNNTFPETSALEEYNKLMQKKSTIQRTGNWTSMGPNNTPGGYAGLGRVNCVEFHPTDNNTFWIGTPAGGLWKTTDGGSNWIPLTDNNGVLGVSDIALANDFETSNTMFIATGDRAGGSLWSLGGDNVNDNNSIGVLKSTNGGETWTETGLTFLPRNKFVIGRLLIDPNDGNIMIAGTSNGIFRSEDGGNNWDRIYSNIYAIDMEFHPTNSDIVYASTQGGNQSRIFKSTDNGQNFETVESMSGGDRTEMAVTPANPELVYAITSNTDGGLEGIYKSTNAGDDFTKVFDGNSTNASLLGYYSNGSGENTGQGSYDLAIAASPTNENELFIAGINTWKSTNGGTSWNISNVWTSSYSYNTSGAPVAHADKHVLKYRPSDGVLFEGNDGGIYKSANNGTSWSDLSNGLGITQIYRIGGSATNANMVITGNQDNGSKLVNGTSWSDVTGGDGMECLIDYTSTSVQYATYVNGKLYRTTNSWGSRTTISDNIPGGANGAWVAPYIIDPVNNQTLYIAYDKIWKTTNRGTSWTQAGNISSVTDKFRSMAISQSDNDIILAADLKNIYKTTDGGSSWANVTSNISTSTNITNVAIHATNPDIMWATLGGYSTNRVYETTNGGDTWAKISSGLPYIPIYSIVQNKLNTEHTELYIGTEFGVWLKRGDTDWIQFMEGLPNATVTELEIYYGSDAASSKLRAATFGRGLWQSSLYEPAPYANFNADNTTGEMPFTVEFTNQSVDSDTFTWDFGDGTTSNETDVTHTYAEIGTYTVSLIATDGTESDTEIKTDYITVTEPTAIADFSASPTTTDSDTLTVMFSNLSENADDYEWNFGDSNSSTDVNPTHKYMSSGLYTVSLTANNSFNSDTHTKTDYINITGTGIDIMQESPFTIYPNPGKDVFTIVGTEDYMGKNVQLQVLSQSGKTVKTLTVKISDLTKIDLTELESGIYFIVFPFDNNRLINKLIIK